MIFFDTETTGLIRNAALPLNQQPRIIELGAVKENGDEFSMILDPGIQIDSKITEITGLDNDDLLGKPTFRDALPELIEFFIGEESIVAHNLPFDMGLLVFELRRLGKETAFPYPPRQIDTVQMAKPFYKGKYMKLQALYEDLIGPYAQTHRALDDAMMLRSIYHALMVKG